MILKTAVEARGEVQDFESELIPRGGDIPQVVKAPPCGINSDSKGCAYPPHSTAVFRIMPWFKSRLPHFYDTLLFSEKKF